jgi:hypothetical protein
MFRSFRYCPWMNMRLITLFTVMSFLLSPAAFAGPACYSKAEAEADQGIRIHSELMVIGLNCQHMGKRHGENLYRTYREFTARHGKLFATYEKLLVNFYRKTGVKNPEASLNTLRTQYANTISNNAAGMRPDVFCATYAPRIQKADKMNEREVRKWAATIFPEHPVSKPLCKAS